VFATIIFEEVESFSQVSNFEALHAHAWAGNITDWEPAQGAGTTYIDLSGGHIAIAAKNVRFERTIPKKNYPGTQKAE